MNYYSLPIWCTVYRHFSWLLLESWNIFTLYSSRILFYRMFKHFLHLWDHWKIFPRCSVFYFLDQKDFLKPVSSVAFWENIFMFWYPLTIINVEFRIFAIILSTWFLIRLRFYISRFHFYCSMIHFAVFNNSFI